MALEPAFDNIDDLEITNPTDGDPVEQGDDHLRGIKQALKGNVTGDDTETRLLVGGAVHARVAANDLAVLGDDASNVVFRLRRRSDNANRGVVYWNNANTRLQIAAQAGTGERADLRLQVQGPVAGNQTVLDAFGDGDTVAYADGTERLRLAADAEHQLAGNLTELGTQLSVDGRGAGTDTDPVQVVGHHAAGGFGLRVRTNGNVQLEQRDAAGLLEYAILRRARDGVTSIFHGPQDGMSAAATFVRGLEVGIDGSQTPDGGAGGQVIFKGEDLGANPSVDVAVGNSSGDFAVSHAGVEGLRVKAADGSLEQRVADVLVAKAIANGVRVYGTGASARVELYRDGAERGNLLGTAVETSLNSVGELRLQRNASATVLLTEASGRLNLYGAGTARLRVLETVQGNSFATVRDEGSTFRPVGFNVIPIITIGSEGSRNLASTDCGRKVRLNASGETLTVVDGLEDDFACLVFNDSPGDCQILEGAGITIDWFTGAGKVSGPYTIASGDAVLLTRRGSSTTWWIR